MSNPQIIRCTDPGDTGLNEGDYLAIKEMGFGRRVYDDLKVDLHLFQWEKVERVEDDLETKVSKKIRDIVGEVQSYYEMDPLRAYQVAWKIQSDLVYALQTEPDAAYTSALQFMANISDSALIQAFPADAARLGQELPPDIIHFLVQQLGYCANQLTNEWRMRKDMEERGLDSGSTIWRHCLFGLFMGEEPWDDLMGMLYESRLKDTAAEMNL